MFGRARKPDRLRGPRILFATDIHGSEQCFRKFLNAGVMFDAQYLVLGGDITGKLMIPIVREASGRYSCRYGEQAYTDLDEDGRRQLEATIARFGHYPIVGSREELAELEDPDKRDEVFRARVYDSVKAWVALAEERLRGTGRRCFIAPGNDDFVEIDEVLQSSDVVEFSEGRCLRLDDKHEMITIGSSNPTPWNTERELPEDELRKAIDAVAAEVTDPANLVAALHVPPFGSGLDSAPVLDHEFGMKIGAGGLQMAPVGSTAVRGFIENFQPLVALHGHIHEGRGAVTIGRTLCLNPGSEYTEGVLDAAIVELGDGTILSHQLVAG